MALTIGALTFTATRAAEAAESKPAMQPGASTGSPAGALPPPGLYLNVDSYLNSGKVENGKGEDTGIRLSGSGISAAFLYVPGWKVLSANYGMALIVPFSHGTFDGKNAGLPTQSNTGFNTTIIVPEILSWALGQGNFVSEKLGIYIPDGRYVYVNNATGYATSSNTVSNNFWTIEPGFAYSYLHNGWNFTLNNNIDFNLTNPKTHYHTGDIYYLDWTIAHSFGPYTVGLIGNYVQQFTRDSKFGEPVSDVGNTGGYGHEYMHASVGPLLAYELGRTTLTIRYLYGFAGRNGGNQSFFHVGISMPLFQ